MDNENVELKTVAEKLASTLELLLSMNADYEKFGLNIISQTTIGDEAKSALIEYRKISPKLPMTDIF